MPQITINSTDIAEFGFKSTFKPADQSVVFDTSSLTTYNNASGSGFLYVLGICFSVIDQDGVVLSAVDWDNPQIQPALSETTFTLDLSSVGVDFFFQTYKIIGYIKDAGGRVYQTTQINKKICQPVDINSNGYVDGILQVTSNCPSNTITVKEVTKTIYNNQEPESKTKSGNLYYPTGTISPVAFTGTPFTNDVIYTGQYRVVNTTTAVYNISDDTYVNIEYRTDNVFPVTCSNKVQDILCCLVDLQKTKTANCNTKIGERAAQQLQDIEIPFFIAISKEFAGQDASSEVDYIRKKLNCSCGGGSIIRNEFTPINPSVTTIVLNGVGGTSIAAPTISGNTKTFNVQSNTYVVAKDNTLDTAFSITIDTSVVNVVKYKIALNYTVLAQTILNTIGGDNTLLTQFNSLINVTNFAVDLTNLNGKCIIDLSSIDYFLSLKVPSASSTIVSVLINGTTYTTTPIAVNNTTAILSWLNGLSLGTFTASYSTGTSGSYVNILTTANANTITSATFNIGNTTTVLFQKTNKSLIAFLQAFVDYVCTLSDLEVSLSTGVNLCYVDYNGNQVTTSYPALTPQSTFNQAIATALCNTVSQINQQFNNALTKSGALVQLGGDLVKNTVIALNGKTFRVGNSLVSFDVTGGYISNTVAAGTTSSDAVTVLFQPSGQIGLVSTTVGERNATAYYSTQVVSGQGSGKAAFIGSYIPTTNDAGVTPAPPVDPEKQAKVTVSQAGVGDTGLVEIYGKTQQHTGSSSNFDTLLRVKQMTTAQIAAIDVSLLTAGIIVFNTTTTKFQGYNGTSFVDLN